MTSLVFMYKSHYYIRREFVAITSQYTELVCNVASRGICVCNVTSRSLTAILTTWSSPCVADVMCFDANTPTANQRERWVFTCNRCCHSTFYTLRSLQPESVRYIEQVTYLFSYLLLLSCHTLVSRDHVHNIGYNRSFPLFCSLWLWLYHISVTLWWDPL